MASRSNFRHHVPGDIPTPDKQQPAPSTYMTLMYNLHYTLSTTNYHAPTDHWVVHGTDSLLPADYALRRLKLHGIKRQKAPKIQGLKKHQQNHSLACKKSSCF